MNFDRELLSNALPAYDIGEELGQGGMGVVVSGQHRQLDRRVAIKQLPVAFAADPAVRRRFISEARVLASLDHPHVVPVYDFVEREGICLLVMEFLPGGTLRSQVAAAGGFTGPHAVAVSLACLSGLSAAHRRGVLHRDVKPENMLFSASEVLKVADFGIAKVLGGPGTVITRRGDVIGTPAYIAPEQARGGELSPATDVYAVATMLYELLTGVLPFPDVEDDMALLFKHAYEPPVLLREVAPGVPDPVAAAVMRGLATESADRFGTAESFGTALAEAGAQAWGPGWISAERVPIMDAGPIISVAGYPSGPRRAAPTVAPAESGIVTGEREYPLSHAPTQGTGGIAASPQTASPQTASPQTASPQTASPQTASPQTIGPQTEAAIPARRPSDRRRTIIIAAVVVAIIVIATLAVFLLPKILTGYNSSADFGLRYGPRAASRAFLPSAWGA
jgi:protein kinase-like protein